MKVAVFGAGYVGLVTGACFAELGHEVVVRDVVEAKIDALRAGVVPIHEPGLAEIIERNAERLTFTTDVAEAVDGADVVYIAVGTPPTYSGDADLSDVWTVVDELPQVDRRIVLAMKSTVPVGTGRAGLHAPRPDRDRGVRRGRCRRRRSAPRGNRRSGRARRRRVCRDGEARLQRLPHDT